MEEYLKNLTEEEIYAYLVKKYKHLDFGLVFNKSSIEEDVLCIEGEEHDYNGVTLTVEQWQVIVNETFIDEEYEILFGFLRKSIKSVIRRNSELFRGISLRHIDY